MRDGRDGIVHFANPGHYAHDGYAIPVFCMFVEKNRALVHLNVAAMQEISGSAALKWCTFGSIASIAFYNFFGLSVTKRLSGAGRATIGIALARANTQTPKPEHSVIVRI